MQVRYQAAPRPARETDAPAVGSAAGVRIIPKPAGLQKYSGARGPGGLELEYQLRQAVGLGGGHLFHAPVATANVPIHLARLEHGLLAAEVVAQILLVAGHALAANGM